jgi:hypothetical protein
MESSWERELSFGLNLKKVCLGVGLFSAIGVGTAMAVMNPSQSAYEAYATQKVVKLLDQNVCAEAPRAFNLKQDCKALLVSNRSSIQEFIANNTQRQDFLFFSLYTTDVSVASFLPDYRVEAVGAFRQFHIYQTAQI